MKLAVVVKRRGMPGKPPAGETQPRRRRLFNGPRTAESRRTSATKAQYANQQRRQPTVAVHQKQQRKCDRKEQLLFKPKYRRHAQGSEESTQRQQERLNGQEQGAHQARLRHAK
ncbi:hypothetical protein AVEN_33400-1 [Araneus ventricosus]|uniref:Uncharacterized protein n=1 Tax=Araneus ventricosus TaxID=182803 RepID=A0A4Y2AP12_ARAVE|nr:hypothetical protein AVEN_33400-1 [Araneus ventricosus]